LIALQ
jgi:hypothetical protein